MPTNIFQVPIEMRLRDIGLISDEKYLKVLFPARPRAPLKNVSVIGFDTEFDPSLHKLLSVQLACMVKGDVKSQIYYRDAITAEDLLTLTLDFIKECDVDASSKIILIAHFAQSDIAMIQNHLRDFRLRVYNKAMGAEGEVLWTGEEEHEDEIRGRMERVGKYKLHILDLYGYLPMSLKKIGEMVGLSKVELDASRIVEIMREDPKLFESYAKRDAEICAKALVELREMFMYEYEIDILRYPTIASLSAALFRIKFLNKPSCPIRMEPQVRNVKTKTGWTQRISYMPVYNGILDIRQMALRSYWGGRAEAYFRGYVKGDFEYYDVTSLYPSAALLQPLPNENTEWQYFDRLEDTLNLEGFCEVEFKFPETCLYPSLPAFEEWHNKLYFPLEGRSFCTLSEAHAALNLSAQINKIHGYGFKRGPSEVNHDLVDFIKHFMTRKTSEIEGSLRYELWKLILNALIGKFNQKNPELDIASIQEDLIKNSDLSPEEVSTMLRYHKTRAALKKPRSVGPCWAPEWATLILGKARALMSEFIAKGALFTSTDSILLPKGTDISCESLKMLENVGSGLIKKYECDESFIARTRLYALFKNGNPVKNARHGCIASEEEFNQIVRACLEAGRDLGLKAHKTHIVKLKEALRDGKQLGAEELLERPIKWDWDGKRELINPSINIFREWTLTKPLKTAPGPKEVIRKGTPGRPRKLSHEDTKKIKKLRKEGFSYRNIAKQIGVSHDTVKRALEKIDSR